MMLFARESLAGWDGLVGGGPLATFPSDLSPTQFQDTLSGLVKWVLAWANLY